MFNFLDLYFIIRLNYNRYYNILINLKFSLLVENKNRLIYVDINIVAK